MLDLHKEIAEEGLCGILPSFYLTVILLIKCCAEGFTPFMEQVFQLLSRPLVPHKKKKQKKTVGRYLLILQN